MSNANLSTANATQLMSRKEFNSFVFELFGRRPQADNEAEVNFELGGCRVEVFADSPEGMFVAVHVDLDNVVVIRPNAASGVTMDHLNDHDRAYVRGDLS